MESKDIAMLAAVGIGIVVLGASTSSMNKQDEKTARTESKTEKSNTKQEQRTCRKFYRKRHNRKRTPPSYCQ